MEKFDLPRTKQCSKCPWKVSTNPHDIPDGYCEMRHANLADSIAIPGSLQATKIAMACHHSDGEDNMFCIGWLDNQMGVGNNIPLRMQMRYCNNISEVKVYGEQHEKFENTLPK